MRRFLLQMILLLAGAWWSGTAWAAWDVTQNPDPITKPGGLEDGKVYYFRNVCAAPAMQKALGADMTYMAGELTEKNFFKVVYGEVDAATGCQQVYLQNVGNGKWFSGTAQGWTVETMEESTPLTLNLASKTTWLEWLDLGSMTIDAWIAQGGDPSLEDIEIFPNEGKIAAWKWRPDQLDDPDGDAITLGVYPENGPAEDLSDVYFLGHVWGWDAYQSCTWDLGYEAINPWYAYEAVYVEDPIGDIEALVMQYSAEDLRHMYRAGTDPGCLDPTLVNVFFAKFQEAQDAVSIENIDNLTVALAKTLTDELKAARQALDEAEPVPMREGFYYIPSGFWKFGNNQKYTLVNSDGSEEEVEVLKAMYDAASASSRVLWGNLYKEVKDENNNTVALELPRDRYYMFYISRAEGSDDLWRIQNVKTGRYLQYANEPSSNEPGVAQQILYAGNSVFGILPDGAASNQYATANGHGGGSGTSGELTLWSQSMPDNDASTWFFMEITDEKLVDSLRSELKQNVLESALQSTLDEAQSRYDGGYNALITSEGQLSSNASDPVEGTIANLIDGDNATFYSTSWHESVDPGEPHYLEVRLNESVQNKVAVYWHKREGNHANRPAKISIKGSNDGQSWTEAAVLPLEGDTLPWGTSMPEFKKVVPLNGSYTWLRFDVLETTDRNGGVNTALLNGYPFFTFAEFQLYPDMNADSTFVYSQKSLAYREDMKESYTMLKNALDEARTKVGQATQNDIDALQAAISAFDAIYPDTTIVSALIERARTYYNEAIPSEGDVTRLGTYNTASAHEGLNEAVRTVEGQYDPQTATRAQINANADVLRRSISAFLADINLPKTDTWYAIVNRYNLTDREGDGVPTDQCIYAGGKSIGDGIKWGGTVYEKAMGDPAYLWRFIALTDTTCAVQNLGTGYYMGANRGTSQQYLLSDTVVPFKIAYVSGEQLSLQDAATADDNAYRFTHADNYQNIVTWSASKDSPSCWTFQEMTSNDFFNQHALPMNGMDVFCFPYVTASAGGVYDLNMDVLPVYTLASAKRNESGEVTEITLNPMDIPAGGIPAGTPYILVTPDDDQSQEGSVIADFSIDLNGELSTESRTINGMVGLLTAEEAPVGCGYFQGDSREMTAIEGSPVTISSQSGYINPRLITEDIPAVEGSITVKVSGDGVLNQIKDAIREANTLVTVTSIDGVTVRQNVKASEALKGLPKGVYIIGGKKVSVK